MLTSREDRALWTPSDFWHPSKGGPDHRLGASHLNNNEKYESRRPHCNNNILITMPAEITELNGASLIFIRF